MTLAIRSIKTASVVLLALMMILAAVPASADPPTRFETEPQGTVFGPGTICDFELAYEPGEGDSTRITIFGDGRVQVRVQGEPTLTNTDTGATLQHRSRFTITVTPIEDSEDSLVEFSGRTLLFAFPGDQGPNGDDDGGAFSLQGRASAVLDTTDTFVSFDNAGRTTDLCAALSG